MTATLINPTDTRRIGIDEAGAIWAHALGRSQRAETRYLPGLRADRWCPFREGTRHRICWYAGWRGKALPLGVAA